MIPNQRVSHTDNVPALLRELKATLLVSTYENNALWAIGANRIQHIPMSRPTGIAVQGHQLALAGRNKITEFVNIPEAVDRNEKWKERDAIYFMRSTLHTGFIDAHEIAYGDAGLICVNTAFSCLSTTQDIHNFVPRWSPKHISELLPEDRCHLNGVAMNKGRAEIVTAFGLTDSYEGWREGKHTNGVMLDVKSDEVLVSGLSMPHSPRFHDSTLYVLESGLGRLLRVDWRSGDTQIVATLPGYARGMTCYGNLAFIGLSQQRDEPGERKSGVWIIDLRDGSTFGWIEFLGEVTEVFDVALLPASNPEFVDDSCAEWETIFLLPKLRKEPQLLAA